MPTKDAPKGGKVDAAAGVATVTVTISKDFTFAAGVARRPAKPPAAGTNFQRLWRGDLAPGAYVMTTEIEGAAKAAGSFTIKGAKFDPPTDPAFTMGAGPIGTIVILEKTLLFTVAAPAAASDGADQ